MVAYTYSRVSALNFNTTPASVAKSATGQVYAVADTTFTTPLTVTMVVGGTPATSLSSDANGFFADFTVADRTSVVWKQPGQPPTVLTTTDPVPGATGATGAAGAAGVKGDRGDLASWQASTFYPLNQVITSPAGDLVKVTTAHTSGATYDASKFGWVNNNAANLTGTLPEASVPTRLTATQLGATYGPRLFNGQYSTATADGTNITDTSDGPKATLRYTDTAAHESSVMVISHFGSAPVGTAGGQAYGINIANRTGAKTAFVIHQYSDAGPSIQIDNTDIASGIFVKNTENQTQNPGKTGTGAFVQFMPYGGTSSLFLTNDLVWNNLTAKDMRIVGQNATLYALNVETATDSRALYVSKQGLGAGSAFDVLNKGTGAGINLVQQGAGTGVNITMTDAVAVKYGIFLNAKMYGAYIQADTDGGVTLDVDKTGTGNGTAAKIRNLGTGDTLSFVNASGQVARFSAGGEYENLALGGGILVKSPDGTRYRIAVNSSGVVTATVS